METQRSKRIILYTKKDIPNFNQDNMKLLKKYLASLGMRELSSDTEYGYRCDLYSWYGYILKYQFNQSIKDLDEDDIMEFLYYCKNGGNHSRRMKRRIASMSAFYIFLRKKRIVKENPIDFVDRPSKDVDVTVQTYLSQEQIDDMKSKLYEQNNLQRIVYTLFSLSTMARVRAVCNLRWNQLDFEERVALNVIEKEGYSVTLYFSEEVKEALLELKKQRRSKGIDHDYVFISKYRGQYKKVDVSTLATWARKSGKLIGIDTLHPHDYRHSMATILKNNGMPLEEISYLLNHHGVDVTLKHYIRQDKKKIQSLKDKYETAA